MNTFWRPFLIVALSVILLALLANLIPACDNKVIPLKKLDLFKSLKSSFQPSAKDSLEILVKELHMESDLNSLQSFADKLKELRQTGKGQLRIAYYGDSIIEGDLMSGKLREELQANYGGSGVGLVPITSIVNEFRKTIRHSFSHNWETLSFMSRSPNIPLGMMGYTFIPRNYYVAETIIEAEPLSDTLLVADSTETDSTQVAAAESRREARRYYVDSPSWVEYSAVRTPGGASEFDQIRLFYSRAGSASQVNVSYDGGSFIRRSLNPGEGIQVLDLSPPAPVKRIRLEFDSQDPIHLYGVSFDQPQGVYVDNLSVRGYSGMYFNRIPAEVLSAFQRHLNYDLIILQYGENVSSPNTRDYGFYRDGMIRTVNHIKSAIHDVPILILSAHDRSVKVNGSYQTSADIPILVSAQGEVARETGSAFWNVFEAMGGLNSMQAFVAARPPLASSDYTHFNLAGANKIALMLYEVITTGKSSSL